MGDVWTTNVIVQLRMFGITQKEFAKSCGYSETYMSQVLRGHKNTKKVKKVIEDTLKKIKSERNIYI